MNHRQEARDELAPTSSAGSRGRCPALCAHRPGPRRALSSSINSGSQVGRAAIVHVPHRGRGVAGATLSHADVAETALSQHLRQEPEVVLSRRPYSVRAQLTLRSEPWVANGVAQRNTPH